MYGSGNYRWKRFSVFVELRTSVGSSSMQRLLYTFCLVILVNIFEIEQCQLLIDEWTGDDILNSNELIPNSLFIRYQLPVTKLVSSFFKYRWMRVTAVIDE